jgi:pyrimidine operon attenuation protein/uracil phosphoribosyltransferase
MRRQNVRGAFVVSSPSDVAGKHVLLIDDILTTGATVRAASKALVQAGAASIWVATLARARRVNEFGREVPFGNEERNSIEPAVDSPVESRLLLHGQSFF